jgi:hypothetical protein
MALYYRYRLLRLDNLLTTTPYDNAPAEDRQFLQMTNEDFREGIKRLRAIDQSNQEYAHDPQAFHRRIRKSRTNSDPKDWLEAPRKLTPMEQDILAALTNAQALNEDVVSFFDHFVHDSIAGFAQDGVRERLYNAQGHLRHRTVFLKVG